MIAFYLPLWLITVALLLVACYRLEHAQAEIRSLKTLVNQEVIKHDRCHQRTEKVLTAYHGVSEARVLEEAAAAYASPEEKTNLIRIARTEYRAGGPDMPVLWLRDRAEKKRQRSVHDEEVI